MALLRCNWYAQCDDKVDATAQRLCQFAVDNNPYSYQPLCDSDAPSRGNDNLALEWLALAYQRDSHEIPTPPAKRWCISVTRFPISALKSVI